MKVPSLTCRIVGSVFGESGEVPIETLNEASARFRAFINRNDLGASAAGSCEIVHAGKVVAHVSYNGKVWEGAEWLPGAKPLFDPSEHEEAAA